MNELQLSFKNISFLLTSIQIIFSRFTYLLYIFIAVVLNIIIFVATSALFVLLFNYISFRIEDQLGVDSNTYVTITLNVIFLLIGIFFSGLIFPSISSIVNSIVYDGLSEKVLKEYSILPRSDRNMLQTILISMGFEFKKIILVLLILFISLLVNLIPGIGSFIYILISVVSIILINGLDTMNAPLATQDYKFREKINYIVKHPSSWFYLWITASLNALPVVNIFTIPLTVVSSTLVYKELLNSN